MLEEGEEIKPRLSDAVIVATSASANENESSVVTVVIQRLLVSVSPNVVPVDEFSRPHQVWTPCMSHSHPRSWKVSHEQPQDRKQRPISILHLLS